MTLLADAVEKIKAALGDLWLPKIYRERILPLRTRSYDLRLSSTRAVVVIQHTLLGVELKIGRRRVMCPDLATARYLAVFATAGCSTVAVPYDISRISRLADDLESGWQRMLILVESEMAVRGHSVKSRLRNMLVKDIKRAIGEAGAGPALPEFRQTTSQRRTRSA